MIVGRRTMIVWGRNDSLEKDDGLKKYDSLDGARPNEKIPILQKSTWLAYVVEGLWRLG